MHTWVHGYVMPMPMCAANGRSEKTASGMTTDCAFKVQSVHCDGVAEVDGSHRVRKTRGGSDSASTYSWVVESVYPLDMWIYAWRGCVE